jgi:hypothetical protein
MTSGNFSAANYVWKFLKPHLPSFMVFGLAGLVIGFFAGSVLDISNLGELALIALGALITVFLEEAIKRYYKIVIRMREIDPLVKILGTLVTDEPWVYIDPMLRNPNDPDHSQLFRSDSDWLRPIPIRGTGRVYGRGDAIALSLVHNAVEKATLGTKEIQIVEPSKSSDVWGRSIVCIGAHNLKTREILDKFRTRHFEFVDDYRAIVRADDKPIINSQGLEISKRIIIKKGGDASNTDYGLIIKLKDEFHPSDKTIIIVAGLGDEGTAGAAYFLLNRYKELPVKESFGVVVEVSGTYQTSRSVEFDTASVKFVIERE